MSVEALARQLATADPAVVARFLETCDPDEAAAVEAALTVLEREQADADAEREIADAERWRRDPAHMAHHLTRGRLKLWRYVQLLGEKYRQAVRGESIRQIWNLPARYGKSVYASQWGPTWMLDDDPSKKLILVSYGDTLALENAIAVRSNLREHAAVLRATLTPDRQQAGRFTTIEGGGLLAAGILSTITGFGGHGIVFDDPFKNWQEAHSEARRELIDNTYKSVVTLRLENEQSFIVVVQTRWHEDDQSGRLLKRMEDGTGEAWDLVRVPAIAEPYDPQSLDALLRVPDPLGRTAGDPIEVERFSLTAVKARALSLGSYLASALEQQRPAPEEGGEIKRAWFRLDDNLPANADEWVTCLPAGTAVFTDGGPVPVEQIRVGERVWSLDDSGKGMRLARVWRSERSGYAGLLRFETNGRTVRCTPAHRLLVRRKMAAPRSGPGGYKAVRWRTAWIPAGEVTTKDYLVAAHGLPDGFGDEAPTGRLLTEGFMAFAGLMLGDGSVLRDGVSVARAPGAPYMPAYEREAHLAFRAARGSRVGVPRGQKRPGDGPILWRDRGVYSRCFSSRSASSELRELGFAGVATTKRVPEWVFGLRPDLILGLLAGYLDADGAVNTRGHITYSSINSALLEDVRHLCMALGIPVSRVCRYKAAGRAWVLGRWVMYQVFLFDPTANVRILPRHPEKRLRLQQTRQASGRGSTSVSRWQPGYVGSGPSGSRPGEGFGISGVALVRVKRIVAEPAEDVFDLGVEGSHSFIADGVIVHNSWDMKLKDKESGDFVVGQTWARTGASYWLTAQLRGQWNQPTTENAIALAGVRQPMVRLHVVENSGNGPEVAAALREAKDGYEVSEEVAALLGMTVAEREAVSARRRRGLDNVHLERVQGDKRARMRVHSGLLEAGSVHVWASAPWLGPYLDEMAAFPNGAHDDQVDASSQALKYLRGGGPVVVQPPPRAPVRAPISAPRGGGMIRVPTGRVNGASRLR